MKIRVSEVFRSIQGEGLYTGALSVWVRFFGCNLQCDGFMQCNPTDPKTYILPYQTINVDEIKSLNDLPVFEYGCDSGYSWSTKFKHLANDYTEDTLAEKIKSLLPENKWEHPRTGNFFDLCFTGGEPMMQQRAMIAVMKKLNFDLAEQDRPIRVQIETNGTKPLTKEFIEFVNVLKHNDIEVCFNISPKLFNVSGEKPSVAWKPEIIKSYFDLNSGEGCLKFVVSNHKNAWKELDDRVNTLNKIGVNQEIFVMPVGATKEQQENSEIISGITSNAISRGYHVSGRLHCNIFGNTLGT